MQKKVAFPVWVSEPTENNFKAKVSKAKQTNKQKIKLIHKRIWIDKHITLEKSRTDNCLWGASRSLFFLYSQLQENLLENGLKSITLTFHSSKSRHIGQHKMKTGVTLPSPSTSPEWLLSLLFPFFLLFAPHFLLKLSLPLFLTLLLCHLGVIFSSLHLTWK